MTSLPDLPVLFGIAGAALTVVSNLMKRMVYLRVFAAASNIAFFTQAFVEASSLLCALQASLFAINGWRLWSLQRMVRSLEASTRDTPVGDWLLPQMKKQVLEEGAFLFRRGEPADSLFFLTSGRVLAVELDEPLTAGRLIGEIGLFSQERTRPVSVVCTTTCTVHRMSHEALYLLFVQNPVVAFYLTRLLVRQLREELERRHVTDQKQSLPSHGRMETAR